MRVTTQIVAGYLLTVAAAVALAVLGHFNLAAVRADVGEVAHEWEESDLLMASLITFDRASDTQASRDELHRTHNALLESALEAQGGATRHEEREHALLLRLADLALEAQRASEGQFASLAAAAHGIVLEFMSEDRDRVPSRLDEVEQRQRRLHSLNLASGVAILLLPLLFLAYLQTRVLRPLGRIQARVASLGGTGDVPVKGETSMRRLSLAIDAMADAVEARQRTLRQEVATRTLQLRHADRLGGIGRIAAAVAHEMNTPLGSIGLCLEGIREGLGEGEVPRDEIRRYCDTAAAQIESCTATTSKLLTYAHFRPRAPSDAAVERIVGDAADLVASHLRRHAVRLSVEGDVAGMRVRGDIAQLRQVLVNLLLNAIDASPRGGLVRVEGAARGDGVDLVVTDEGPGVPPVARDEIFDPFFTTKRPGEGTGLGLSIAREIVEAHGGALSLDSNGDGRPGAAFRVHLPVVPAEAP